MIANAESRIKLLFHHRIVRQSSPGLNYIMIIGATALTLTGTLNDYSLGINYIFVTTFCMVSMSLVTNL